MNAPTPTRALRRATRGFTLIEVMITVAIIAILARLALPSYMEYVKRGKLTEGFNTLSSFSLTLGQWYQDNRTYAAPAAICTAGTMAAQPPNTANFQYSCTPPAPTATTYTITATGLGSLAGFVFTIDQAGNRATTGVPTGWTTNTQCWVASKAGTCY